MYIISIVIFYVCMIICSGITLGNIFGFYRRPGLAILGSWLAFSLGIGFLGLGYLETQKFFFPAYLIVIKGSLSAIIGFVGLGVTLYRRC